MSTALTGVAASSVEPQAQIAVAAIYTIIMIPNWRIQASKYCRVSWRIAYMLLRRRDAKHVLHQHLLS
jgi:hypothetical protein